MSRLDAALRFCDAYAASLQPVRLTRYEEVEDQRNGVDFKCEAKYDVETKADVPGGVWGTGNLFVQTHELHHQHGERNGHRKAA
jgi:hypothetical protein